MVHTLIKVGITIVALGLPAVVHADELSNGYRCDALHLRRKSDQLDCEARCMQRAAARQDGSPVARNEALSLMSDCEKRCQKRYDDAIVLLSQRPPCGHEPPDPRRCLAKLLDAEANSLMCGSHCENQASRTKGFDVKGCEDDCSKTYGTTKDQILALDICRNGPAVIR